jgi:hypothetical protein
MMWSSISKTRPLYPGPGARLYRWRPRRPQGVGATTPIGTLAIRAAQWYTTAVFTPGAASVPASSLGVRRSARGKQTSPSLIFSSGRPTTRNLRGRWRLSPLSRLEFLEEAPV